MMATRVQGLSHAISVMRKISSGDFLDKPGKRYAARVKGDLKGYPPALDPSWRRTGNLGRKWFATVKGADIEFSNSAPYSGWVQGEDGNPEYHQVWWHRRTGWKQVDDVSEKHIDYYKSEVVKEILRMV